MLFIYSIFACIEGNNVAKNYFVSINYFQKFLVYIYLPLFLLFKINFPKV